MASKKLKNQLKRIRLDDYFQFYYCKICNVVVLTDDPKMLICGHCGGEIQVRKVWSIAIQNLINLDIKTKNEEEINLLLEENKQESA